MPIFAMHFTKVVKCSANAMKIDLRTYSNPLWAILGALVFLLVFSWSTSPLYTVYGTDSPFFQIIGLGILQGKVPYVDLFDHKGPLIFFIDALGYAFGIGKTGIFLLQWVFMSVTLIFLYKIARLFVCSDGKAFAAVALCLIPLVDFIIEGNQCEEWMLPIESAAVYLALKWALSSQDRFKLLWSLVFGLAFSFLFYIRPNDGVMWIGGLYFGIFLYLALRRRYAEAFGGAGMFLLGFAGISACIFPYFIAHNAVPDLFKGMILHNIQYASDVSFSFGGLGMVVVPIIIIGVSLYLLCFRNAESAPVKSKSIAVRNTEFLYLLIPVAVLVVAFIGKRDYYHYLLPLMPFMAMCMALLIGNGRKKFIVVLCVLFAAGSTFQVKCISKAIIYRSDYKTLYEQTDALFGKVPEEERNNIWNYNLTVYSQERHRPHMASLTGAFLHKGITPGNAAFEPFQMDYAYPESEYGIRANMPQWVILQTEAEFTKDLEWIYGNYLLVYSTPSEPVCEIRLYRLREQEAKD